MRTYHPLVSEDVPASPPHLRDTCYRVSIGLEYWDGRPHRVEKVQMVYDGQVSGRRAPSYPAETADHDNVVAALKRLRTRAASQAIIAGFSESAAHPPLGDLIGSAKGVYGRTQKEIEIYLKNLDDEWP